ncbi:MAG: hypothetical protein RSE22_07335, partial [Mucinivorans sp.]
FWREDHLEVVISNAGKIKKLFEFVTEVILELFLFLFLSCKSDFSELNEDLQGGNWGKKSQKERD